MQQLREHADAAYNALREVFEDPTTYDATYESLRLALNMPAIDYCLRRYITAECDAATPGERGLGRVSTAPPRLGGYCRRQITALDPASTSRLYFLIQDVVLRGYLAQALLIDDLPPVRITDSEVIFRKWVPVIYSGAGAVSDGVANMVSAVADTAFENLEAFLGRHGMPSLYDESAKMGQIVWPYAKSGTNLRAVECGAYGF